MKRLLLIGVGDGAEKLFGEIKDNPHLSYDVVGFLDDNLSKLKKNIHGVSVLGAISDMRKIVQTNII